MKKASLTSMLITFGCFCVQCSSNYKSANVQTSVVSQPANNAVLTNKDTKPNANNLEATRESESLMLQFLKRESRTLGIRNLREAALNNSTEIRMWLMWDVAIPRCFILENSNGDHKAFYVAAVKEKNGIAKTPLAPPRSGWNDFDRFLKEQGIDAPIKLSLDENTIPNNDYTIVVEAKSGTEYSMVFYDSNTKSKDGQKVLRFCRRVEEDFSVKMGCD